jgi:hypothetical protein
MDHPYLYPEDAPWTPQYRELHEAMETCTYTLPAHWAPALVNGDFTGMEDDDEEALMRVVAGENLPDPLSVNDEPEFVKYHDAQPYGVLACDCLVYTFPA